VKRLIGYRSQITIGDLVNLIGRLMDKPVRPESQVERMRPEASEVERLLADNTRAREILGWEPKINLEEGLQRTIDWLRQNPERYSPGVYSI
jgi:dTDP-glucose 4,6-dehydratase